MQINRKEIEDDIKSLIKQLDPDPKGNLLKYDEFFESMSNQVFEEWFNDFLDGKEHLFFFMPNFIKNISNDDLIKIAEKNNVKIFHKLIFTDENGRQTESDHEYMVVKLPVRRVVQYLDKKYSMPMDDKQISALTGQVMNDSKGSRMSLPQIRLMMAKNLDATVNEFINCRGGNVEAYREATQQMAQYGEFSQAEIESKQRTRAVDVTSSIIKSMMLDTTL
jgi:hypothetical protein